MEIASYLEHVERDGLALAAAARGAMDRTVPSCPDWKVADLVVHTGMVHRDKALIVRAGGTEKPDLSALKEPSTRDAGELLSWYEEGVRDLLEVLREKDPEDEAWSWSGDHRVAFWCRRMAQETAVHRWDAQNAAGVPEPIDSELAVDGIAEMLEVMVPSDAVVYEGTPGTVHPHCTDREGEWVVTLVPGEVPAARRAHEKCDVAVRGTASDLLLLLWRRIEPSAVEVLGDEGLLREFWSYMRGPGQ